MFIVYGTRRIERAKGQVADYCPICRTVRAFRLLRIGMASHIYYISFGSGKLVDHQIECLSCGVRLSVDPASYERIETGRSIDLSTLEHVTNPRLQEKHAERIASDAQLQHSPALLNPDTRRERMIEPFRLLNPRVELRFHNSTQLDRQAGIGCFGTILLTVAAFWIASTLPSTTSESLFIAGLVVLGIGSLYTFVQLHFAPGRFTRTKIAPILLGALRPLQPTQEELQDILARCRTADMKISRQFKADWLWMELQRTPSEASPG